MRKLLQHLLTLLLLTMPFTAHASTPAERLLATIKNPPTSSFQQVQADVLALLDQLKALPSLRERFDDINRWEGRIAKKGEFIEGDDHVVILSPGPVTARRLQNAIVLADGDVTVEMGFGLLVIATGKIEFLQDHQRETAGVFVTQKTFTAPWAVNLLVHAQGGATFKSDSLRIQAFNTAVRSSKPIGLSLVSGNPVFSALPALKSTATPPPGSAGKFPFVGERCLNGASLDEVAAQVPAIARSNATCPDIDLAVARCIKSTSEEIWTVHICKNQLVDVASRKRSGGPGFEFRFKSPREGIPTTADSIQIIKQ